jgi:uncharacterized protein YndB with AHSA1/START domain
MAQENRVLTERSDDRVAAPDDRVLTITRIFDAPRARVFQAFIDPEQLMQWMGPRSHPIFEMRADIRPGGAWRFGLRAVDGDEVLWQSGTYREIVPNRKLAFTFAWDPSPRGLGPETLVEITFEDQGAKTLMTFRQSVFDSPANCDGHRVGWNSAFDRLADLF